MSCIAGTIGMLTSTIQLLQDGATHFGVATDHVIESFRNDLYSGYKTSEGMQLKQTRKFQQWLAS
jgi:hypothetical protein